MLSGCSDAARLERRDRSRVLSLARVGDAEIELRDRNLRLARDDFLQQRDRARERAIFHGEDRVVQRVGDSDSILGVDAAGFRRSSRIRET